MAPGRDERGFGEGRGSWRLTAPGGGEAPPQHGPGMERGGALRYVVHEASSMILRVGVMNDVPMRGPPPPTAKLHGAPFDHAACSGALTINRPSPTTSSSALSLCPSSLYALTPTQGTDPRTSWLEQPHEIKRRCSTQRLHQATSSPRSPGGRSSVACPPLVTCPRRSSAPSVRLCGLCPLRA
jgi:hypothetical protein